MGEDEADPGIEADEVVSVEIEADEITDPGPIPVDMPNPMQPSAPTVFRGVDGSGWVIADGKLVPTDD